MYVVQGLLLTLSYIYVYYPYSCNDLVTYYSACWTNDCEVGVRISLAAGGHVAAVGQLLFAPWAWVYSTLHPFGVGK